MKNQTISSMGEKKLNYIIKSFFNIYWLRLESVPWEVSLYQKNRYLFKNIIKKKKH